MELIEAMRQRKSIRAFTSEPVPRDMIKDILSNACWAPSALNTQPWEFVVVHGEKLNELGAAIVDKFKSSAAMQPDHLVIDWPNESIYKARQIALAKGLFKSMDIPWRNKEKRDWWLERGYRFFDAPVAIIIITDNALTKTSHLLDIGAVMQNICLAALQWGLGTCIEFQGVLYPEAVRKHTGIPVSKNIIIAIAMGYPDPDFPANSIRSERESAKNLTTWME